jgi:Flp pilus assembly protein TadB
VLFIFPQELATMLVTIVGLIIIVIGLTLALIAILWLRKLPVEIQGESTIIE